MTLSQQAMSARTAKEAPRINDVYVVFLIIDGVNRDFLFELLNKGELPILKKYFVDEGATFTDAVTVFPSASAGAYQSFITGLFPGHAGIPYLEWFNRTQLKPIKYLSVKGHKHINANFLNWRALLDPDEPALRKPTTIFELLGNHPSAAVYSEFYLGAKTHMPKLPVAGIWSTFVSRRVVELDKYAWLNTFKLFNNPIEEIPRLTLVGFYSEDEYGHEEGAKSEYVKFALKYFEDQLEKFIGILKMRGIWEKTYIIVASDHGMHNIKGTFNLKRYLKEKGFNLVNNNPHKKNANVYVSARGVSSAQVYIKGKGGWETRPSLKEMKGIKCKNGQILDIIEAIKNAEPTDILAVRDGHHKIHVYSKTSHAVIIWEEVEGRDWYGYIPDNLTDDPLGYSKDKKLRALIISGMHEPSEWGPKSAKTDYPDAITQLGQIMRDGRAGDIIISSRDWSFYRLKKATHGTLHSSAMHFPILMRGPTVPRGTYGFMRSVDMYPTILGWFGLEVKEDHHDGTRLFPRTDKRGPPSEKVLAERLACMDLKGGASWCTKDSVPESAVLNELKRKEALLVKLQKIKRGLALPHERWYINQQIERVEGDITKLKP